MWTCTCFRPRITPRRGRLRLHAGPRPWRGSFPPSNPLGNRRRVGDGGFQVSLLRWRCGKREGEDGPTAAFRVVEPDPSRMRLDDPADHRKAKACPLRVRLLLDERSVRRCGLSWPLAHRGRGRSPASPTNCSARARGDVDLDRSPGGRSGPR